MGDENRKYCPFGETESTSYECTPECPLWHEEANCCSIRAAADAVRKIARQK